MIGGGKVAVGPSVDDKTRGSAQIEARRDAVDVSVSARRWGSKSDLRRISTTGRVKT